MLFRPVAGGQASHQWEAQLVLREAQLLGQYQNQDPLARVHLYLLVKRNVFLIKNFLFCSKERKSKERWRPIRQASHLWEERSRSVELVSYIAALPIGPPLGMK